MADRQLTDVELERWLADDLPAARVALATPADKARREELRAEHAAFLATVDVDAEVRSIGKKMATLEPERKPAAAWWRWIFTGGALAAAAAAVLVLVRRDPPPEEDIITKGAGVTLVVHAATEGAGSRPLSDGAAIAPGTRIRFEVGSARSGYLTVIGFDAAGATTVYYPYGGAAAVAYDPASGGLLPGAIAVDATPGAETFYAVFSEKPFAVEAVAPAVQGKSAFPPGISAGKVVLTKQLEK